MHVYKFTTLLEEVGPMRLLGGFFTALNAEKASNKDFDEDDYVWVVGSDVFNRLKNFSHMYMDLWRHGTEMFMDMDLRRMSYSHTNEIILDKKENYPVLYPDFAMNATVKSIQENQKKLMEDVMNRHHYVDTDMLAATAANEAKEALNTQFGRSSMWSFDKEETRMNIDNLQERLYALHDAASIFNAYKAYEAHKAAQNRKPEDPIEKVIFNDPATIVLWKDGTKTVVMAENEPFDPEKGLAMAIAKRSLGNHGNYYDIFSKHLPEEKNEEPAQLKEDVSLIEMLTSKQLAEKLNTSISTVLRDCRRGLHPGATKNNGKWLIPYTGIAGGDDKC